MECGTPIAFALPQNDTCLGLYVVYSARQAGDRESGNVLFRNNRDGTFPDVTA